MKECDYCGYLSPRAISYIKCKNCNIGVMWECEEEVSLEEEYEVF